MEIGINSFAALLPDSLTGQIPSAAQRLSELLQEIMLADGVGIDVFGVGGTPESFVRAGRAGHPLMLAIIGGDFSRFRPLLDLYREAGRRAGHGPDRIKVGIHVTGFIAETTQEAKQAFYPGWSYAFTKIGKERGWGPVTYKQFESSCEPEGPFLIGDPFTVIAKAHKASQALGGLSRISFQMSAASGATESMSRSIELLGKQVAPELRRILS